MSRSITSKCCLIFLLLPSLSWGAVAFDAGAGDLCSEATTCSYSHTVASGATIMTFGITVATSSGTVGTITAPTFNGVSSTLVTSNTSFSGAVRQAVYCLDNPASGAHSASVTISGLTAGSDSLHMGTMSFTGSANCASMTNTNTANGTSAAPSVTVSGVASTSIVGDVACQGTDLTVGTNQTSRYGINNSSNTCASLGVSTQAGSNGGVMDWTSSGSDSWQVTAYEIPVLGGGGGGSTLHNLLLMGVGQ